MYGVRDLDPKTRRAVAKAAPSRQLHIAFPHQRRCSTEPLRTLRFTVRAMLTCENPIDSPSIPLPPLRIPQGQ